jgi:hypothetical protein
MNRKDLILDVIVGVGPMVYILGYTKSYIFENYDKLETFALANPDIVNAKGQHKNDIPLFFLTKADAVRLGIEIRNKGFVATEEYGPNRAISASVARVKYFLSLELPDEDCVGESGRFDPWEMFPCFYGTYSAQFDEMAISVLEKMRDDISSTDEGLGEEMFREYLCRNKLANYGTSPRTCFVEYDFRDILPTLIEKWKAYARLQWGGWAKEKWPAQEGK